MQISTPAISKNQSHSSHATISGTEHKRLNVKGFILGDYSYAPRTHIPTHTHANANLACVLSGGFTENVNGTDLELKPGHVIIKPAGVPHSDKFGDREVRVLWVEFDPKSMAEYGLSVPAFERYIAERGGPLSWLSNKLYREIQQVKDPATELSVKGLLLELLAEVSRQGGKLDTRPPAWLLRARDYIQSEYLKEIRLRPLAKLHGVHPVHLCREFRRHFGCTVGELVRRLRVAHAAQQLTETETPIQEIADLTGFADQAHFTRIFKTHTGTTPLQYRKSSLVAR
jgi:AraC family transcriptional regulator